MKRKFIVICRKTLFGYWFEVIDSQKEEWRNFAKENVGKVHFITHEEVS